MVFLLKGKKGNSYRLHNHRKSTYPKPWVQTCTGIRFIHESLTQSVQEFGPSSSRQIALLSFNTGLKEASSVPTVDVYR